MMTTEPVAVDRRTRKELLAEIADLKYDIAQVQRYCTLVIKDYNDVKSELAQLRESLAPTTTVAKIHAGIVAAIKRAFRRNH